MVKLLNVNGEFLRSGELPVFLPDQKEACGVNAEKVPLYDLKDVKNLRHLLRPANNIEPEDFLFIPHLPKCDGAIFHIGDMMHPIIRSGDMVLYSKIETTEILSGEMYLFAAEISGKERINVCYLDKTENPKKVIMRGANPSDPGTDLEISKIKAIAAVNATIRLNTAK